jgi:RhtB (resistance to homoserine/threonine) family protein
VPSRGLWEAGVIDSQLAAFAGVAALVTITPGADMALVTAVTLRSGPRSGLLAAVGISVGLLIWAVASAVGLAALLAASAMAFTVVKLAGAAYLIFLGVQALWQARTGAVETSTAPGHDQPASTEDGRRSLLRPLRQGLTTNLLNPKIAVFYTSLLPQFIRPGDPVLLRSVLLAGVHVVLGIIWLAWYASVLGRLGARLRRPRVRRMLQRATGTVLIALGIRLAVQER